MAEVTPAAPQPDAGEAAKYAALAQELGIEQEPARQEPEPQTVPEPVKQEPVEEPKPKKTYEEVERDYASTQEALRQERAARKASDEQMQRMFRLIEESRTRREPEKKPEPPKLPEVTEDPIGHFTGRLAELEAKLTEARQGTQQTAEQVQRQQDEAQFWNHVQTSENQFRSTAPKVTHEGKEHSDYDLATEYLASSRVKELELMYPDASEQAMRVAQQNGFRSPADMRGHLFNADRINVAMQAVQLGMNPAELYYNLAKQRGYQTPNGQAGQPRAANGQFTAAQQLEATKRGQNASTTISGGGGRKGSNDMTLVDLADLAIEDPAAFDKAWDEMKKLGRLG